MEKQQLRNTVQTNNYIYHKQPPYKYKCISCKHSFIYAKHAKHVKHAKHAKQYCYGCRLRPRHS